MSVLDALGKIDFPLLGPAISLVVAVVQLVDTVKVYKKHSEELGRRCAELIFTITENMHGLEGSITQQAADQIYHTVYGIHQRMQGWSKLSFHQSMFRHLTIKEGVDFGFRELAHSMAVFNIRSNIDHSRALSAIQNQDQIELRDMLQRLTEDLSELKIAIEQNRSDVPALMESVQMELKLPDLEARQEQDFRKMLWELHTATNELPPLSDLSGQIGDISPHAMVLGGSSDIHTGLLWDRKKVALKRHRAFNCSVHTKRKIAQEVEIWRRLEHQHILPLFGVIFFGGHVSMVSPWMNHGNINKFIRKNPSESKLTFLLEISKGLFYLHDQNIIHGDLRGSNILISDDRTAKIADFGLSKALEEIEEGSNITTAPGSVRWCARELVKPQQPQADVALSAATDSWSFGMLCLEILTMKQPFAHIHRDVMVYSALLAGVLPPRPDRIAVPELTDELWAFLLDCWGDNQCKRPTMKQARFILAKLDRSLSSGEEQTSPSPVSLVAAPARQASTPSVKMNRDASSSSSSGPSARRSSGASHYYALSTPSEGSSRGQHSPLFLSPSDISSSPATSFSTDRTSEARGTTPSGSLESRYSPPLPLRLGPPLEPPADPVSALHESRPSKRSDIEAATSLPGREPDFRLASHGPGAASPEFAYAAAEPSAITWLPLSSAPKGLLFTKDVHVSTPHVPIRPHHILVKGVGKVNVVSHVEAHDKHFFNSNYLAPPPLPPRSPLRGLLSPTSAGLSAPLFSSPECIVTELPPTMDGATSEPPQEDTAQEVVHRRSLWNQLTRLGSKNEAPPITSKPVFGVCLETMLAYAGTVMPVMLPDGREASSATVPTLVTKCGFWLKTHGLHEVGVFHRDLRSTRDVKKLRVEFEKRTDYGRKLDMTGRYSATVAAHVLREFLVELPEPVIPLAYYDKFITILDDKPAPEIAIEKIEIALKAIPPPSRDLLLYMCDLLVTFAKHASETTWRPSGPEVPTNMTCLRDLVTTFRAVLLFHPEHDYRENEWRRGRKVLEFMMENLKRILDDRPLWHSG